jgi:2-hydroxychromene-2-carboxylate isomerase
VPRGAGLSGQGGPIEFSFEFNSPYGYIATQLAEDFEKRVGRPMLWRPILLGPIFKVTGQAPLTEIPLKGAYAKRDFLRTARMHNVPYKQPAKFPIGTVAAARAFYWLDDRDTQKGARARERALQGVLRG